LVKVVPLRRGPAFGGATGCGAEEVILRTIVFRGKRHWDQPDTAREAMKGGTNCIEQKENRGDSTTKRERRKNELLFCWAPMKMLGETQRKHEWRGGKLQTTSNNSEAPTPLS